MPELRVYLAGGLAIEHDHRLVAEGRFPGLQGRIVFAMLAAEHHRSVPRIELEEELWGDSPPAASDLALRAIASKLRRLVVVAGLPADVLATDSGGYRLNLPPGSWIDLEAAADAIHRAEPALRDRNLADAVGWGRVADAISMRPLLPGGDGPWASRTRDRLRGIRIRALECLAESWLALGDAGQAARDAGEALAIDPFREPSHRLLIRSLSAHGDRAGALRAYERCRTLLAEELGADPSAETQAVYLDVLRSE